MNFNEKLVTVLSQDCDKSFNETEAAIRCEVLDMDKNRMIINILVRATMLLLLILLIIMLKMLYNVTRPWLNDIYAAILFWKS